MATSTRVNGWTCGALAAVVLSIGVPTAAQPLVDEAGVMREAAYDHLRRALSGEDEGLREHRRPSPEAVAEPPVVFDLR